MTSPTKKQNQKPKFFSLQIKSAVSPEGLNSSLAQSPGELWSCKEMFETKAHANCLGSEGVNTFPTMV